MAKLKGARDGRHGGALSTAFVHGIMLGSVVADKSKGAGHLGYTKEGRPITAKEIVKRQDIRDELIEALSKHGVPLEVLGNKILTLLDIFLDRARKGELDDRSALMAMKMGLDFIVDCGGNDAFKDASENAKQIMTRADAARKLIGTSEPEEPIEIVPEASDAQH